MGGHAFLVLDNETISDINTSSGLLFDSNRSVMDIDPVALDKKLAMKLYSVDEYWVGIKSKEQLFSKNENIP